MHANINLTRSEDVQRHAKSFPISLIGTQANIYLYNIFYMYYPSANNIF